MGSPRTELGCAGHLIVSSSCPWRRHTQVGDFRISTVGDYYIGDVRTTVAGFDDAYFETMVFRTTDASAGGSDACGCRQVVSYSAIEVWHYESAGLAQAGHEATVARYVGTADD